MASDRGALQPLLRAGHLYATVAAFFAPRILGAFVACARYMEVEWIAVAAICLAGIGLVNLLLSLVPLAQRLLPDWMVAPIHTVIVVFLPIAVVVAAFWLTFEPFWYALTNEPDVLCD